MKLDDLPGGGGGGLAGAQTVLDHVLEVVHGVKVDIIELAHLRLDVARDGDVHHEDRAVAAGLEGPLHRALAQDRDGAGGGGDDDVRLGQVSAEFGEGDGVAVELRGQGMGPLDGAVGDDDATDALLAQVAGGQFDGLPGADEQGGLVLEVGEDLPCQANGGEGHGDRAGADGRVGAHLLGDGEGVLEEAAEEFTGGTVIAGGLEGGLDLAKDLGFTQHHGVEAAGHFQEVGDGRAIDVSEEIRGQADRLDAVEAG